jgi:hypothetical protein
MSTKKIQHTAESSALLAALDADLAAAGQATGDELVWDTSDISIREALALTVDRRASFGSRPPTTRCSSR